MFYIVVMFVYQ